MKRFIALFLALIMSLSLFACGDGKKKDNDSMLNNLIEGDGKLEADSGASNKNDTADEGVETENEDEVTEDEELEDEGFEDDGPIAEIACVMEGDTLIINGEGRMPDLQSTAGISHAGRDDGVCHLP